MLPDTRYARPGDQRIAYQVIGAGPPDLVHADAGPDTGTDADARTATLFRRPPVVITVGLAVAVAVLFRSRTKL